MSAAQHIQPRRIPAVALPITVICFCSLKHAFSIFVSILLAKCVCIMRKIIVNPRRFSHLKDFRKHHKALTRKEKPAITMDCWFSLFWCSSGDSNPGDIDAKQLKMQCFSIFVSIFVSIFAKRNCESRPPAALCPHPQGVYRSLALPCRFSSRPEAWLSS